MNFSTPHLQITTRHKSYTRPLSCQGAVPTLARATLRGYLPTRIKGSLTTMPADFLIDGEGIIRAAHYGEDEGDHIAFDEILAFSRDQ